MITITNDEVQCFCCCCSVHHHHGPLSYLSPCVHHSMVFGLFGKKNKSEQEQQAAQHPKKKQQHEALDEHANPEPDEHNLGQPLRPNLDESGKQRSKFLTDCRQEHAASLKCIEDNYTNRDVCQPFFEAYKKCRRDEKKRKLEDKEQKWQRTHHF
jgi:hypothetical protein